MVDSIIWGLLLGLLDGLFYASASETYNVFLKANRLNTLLGELDIWKMLGVGALLGIVAPIGYLWAGNSVGSLIDVHIYRCLVSVISAIFINGYFFGDTVNGYRGIGFFLVFLGLLCIGVSTSYNV